MYRVDLDHVVSNKIPGLETVAGGVRDVNDNFQPVERIIDSSWQPYPIFDTLGPTTIGGVTEGRRPMYQRPSVFFIPLLGTYGLSFGTGDRDNLFATGTSQQNFYTFVDDSAWDGTGSPPAAITSTFFEPLTPDAVFAAAGTDFLLDSTKKGWFIELPSEEKVITDAFSLSGITFFSSFQPALGLAEEECNSVKRPSCGFIGFSKVFIVNTTNANGFVTPIVGDPLVRYKVVSSFVTNPFTEPGQSKNDPTGTGQATADDLTDELKAIMETLKDLFPEACRFAEYRTDVKALAADTSLQFIAAVPTCIVVKNWQEN